MLPKMGGGPTASPAQPPSSTGGPPPPSPATFDLMGNPVGGNNTQQPSPAGGIVLGGGNTAVGHSNGGGLTIMGVGSVRPPPSNGGVGSGTNLGGKLLDFFLSWMKICSLSRKSIKSSLYDRIVGSSQFFCGYTALIKEKFYNTPY